MKKIKSPLEKVKEISGENVYACYQCGRCSAGCFYSDLMDYLPNQLIRLIQLGDIEEALNSKTIWLCATCFMCSSRCPNGVDLARIMDAVRQVILRSDVDYIDVKQISEEELSILPQIALIANFRKETS